MAPGSMDHCVVFVQVFQGRRVGRARVGAGVGKHVCMILYINSICSISTGKAIILVVQNTDLLIFILGKVGMALAHLVKIRRDH